RAMRANGIDESYITGNQSDREKFRKWAETVPYTMRNPLYHWTHLELRRYFGIEELLNSKTADRIYDECTEKLKSQDFRVRSLLEKMNVKVICTTDDPIDSLLNHQKLKNENYQIPVYPAFRADRALELSDLGKFNNYIGKLEESSNIAITDYNDFLNVLENRHDFFSKFGCSVSDHEIGRASSRAR